MLDSEHPLAEILRTLMLRPVDRISCKCELTYLDRTKYYKNSIFDVL